MPTITPYSGKDVVRVGRDANDTKVRNSRWWLEDNKADLAASLFSVVKQIKETQNWRQAQASLYARLYANLPSWNYIGIGSTKMSAQTRYPNDRPTLNVVQNCTDALVSRMTQSKPKPMFLTDGGDYKKRKLAKDLNKFIDGEFYQCSAYQMGEQALRDSIILGNGILKIYEDEDNRVAVERVLCTEIFVDEADGMYGFPQQLHQLKIADRDVMAALYPSKKNAIMNANAAYFDASSESKNTISSQIMVVESWHLKSGKDATDGKHVIAIDTDVLEDDKKWDGDDFPFVNLPYAPRTLGYWAQGLAEQLIGLQNEINRLLFTIQQSLHLCGVPKWLVEDGSKVVSAHINNQIGGIIKFQGTPPSLQVFQCIPQELYAQLERLVNFSYQQCGISMMAAASQKPAGLDSGVALREYDDLQSDRFAYLSQRYEQFYIDLGKKMFHQAQIIAERDGEYETIYPGKNSLSKIAFPDYKLEDEDFIIQAFPVSALSKNPAERKQEVVDLMQAGLIDPMEGRRLLDYPDIEQQEQLLNAGEERLLKTLDEMVEDGIYSPPDPYMNLTKAKELVLQYYNKYMQENLEEDRADMLRTFSLEIDQMQMAAQPPMPMGMPGMAPQASPMPPPTSPMVPNINQAA